MSLPTNNKKGDNKKSNNPKNSAAGSKFIKGGSKPVAAGKKIRSTGANRGS